MYSFGTNGFIPPSTTYNFTYDAFGNILETKNGLYYLNSRYYNPEIGRFINADGQLNGDLLGYNLFLYCGNNPVRFSDDEGTFWDIAIDVVFTIGSVINVIQNPTSGKAWAALGVDIICMAVPFVLGGGIAVRAASKVDDVVDAGRTVNQVDNSIDVNKSIDIVTPTSNEKKSVSIISGYTRHGLAQAITRNGIGVTPKAILDAVNNPTKVTSKIDNFGRHSTQYKGRMATVVLNADMEIVSCWAKSSKYGRITKAND